jgi:hypothetical protein
MSVLLTFIRTTNNEVKRKGTKLMLIPGKLQRKRRVDAPETAGKRRGNDGRPNHPDSWRCSHRLKDRL